MRTEWQIAFQIKWTYKSTMTLVRNEWAITSRILINIWPTGTNENLNLKVKNRTKPADFIHEEKAGGVLKC